MFSIHPSVMLILGLLVLCGFVYWVIQIRKGIYLQLNTFAETQNNRMRQLEEMIQYSQRQQHQFFQSMAMAQPVIHKPVETPIKPKSKKPVPPPPSPVVEKEETEDDLDELLKEELAELAQDLELEDLELEDLELEEKEVEEISTDSLKKKTEE